MLHWLTHLGGLGLFAVAIIDSSVIPCPLPGSTELLLLWLASYHGNPWLLGASAALGSILGGYGTWCIGRKGGENALLKYCGTKMVKRFSRWAEQHAILSVFLPLCSPPPPFLLSPFIIASGALAISRERFLTVYSLSRTLRYGLITWLGVAYGRGVVRLRAGLME